MHLAAQAAYRGQPLSSNVRHHHSAVSMFSDRKRLLRATEAVALVGVAGAVAVAWLAHVSANDLLPFELAIYALFLPIVWVYVVASKLSSELIAVVRGPVTSLDSGAGLTSGEIASLVKWAPLLYKVACTAALIGLVTLAITTGPMEWGASNPFTPRHAHVVSLCVVCILGLALPVPASAWRMPGSYQEALRGARAR